MGCEQQGSSQKASQGPPAFTGLGYSLPITATPRGPSLNKPLLPWAQHKNLPFSLQAGESQDALGGCKAGQRGGKKAPNPVTSQEEVTAPLSPPPKKLINYYSNYFSGISPCTAQRALRTRGESGAGRIFPNNGALSSWEGEGQREQHPRGLGQQQPSETPTQQEPGHQ